MRAFGTPSTPGIKNGAGIAAGYSAYLTTVAAQLAKVAPGADHLDSRDLPAFRSRFTALRGATIAALESGTPSWSHAQQLDTSRALEHIMRGDKNCYWLAD